MRLPWTLCLKRRKSVAKQSEDKWDKRERPTKRRWRKMLSRIGLKKKDSNENGTNVTIVTNFPVSEKSTSSSSTSTPSTLIPEGRNISSDHAVASRQSSYSNCSSIPDEELVLKHYTYLIL
ncbi:hypothetical protein HUJ05_012072 [Dendroctonus ponderosae]|nr:hypothetical protein HUJ05_012072 [Dendroctonus ponderosae]